MSFIILKHVRIQNKKEVPVILIDSLGEVLTFSSKADAEYYLSLFQTNSDSNHRYEIKNVNSVQECSCGGGCGCS